MIIKKNKFIKFLNYIGITEQSNDVFKQYQKCYNKRFKISEYVKRLNNFEFEEKAINNIVDYLIYPQKRKLMDIEIEKYGKQGAWSKEF